MDNFLKAYKKLETQRRIQMGKEFGGLSPQHLSDAIKRNNAFQKPWDDLGIAILKGHKK